MTDADSGGSGTGGSALGAAGASLDDWPDDTRPARPEWMPALPLGAPGWEKSDEPICETTSGYRLAFDVWADAHAVYAVFATHCNPLGGIICTGAEGGSLQVNDGTGWKVVLELPTVAIDHLFGLPGGPLLLRTYVKDQRGFFFVRDGGLELAYPLTDELLVKGVGVGAGHAFLQLDSRIVEYDSGRWKTLATLPSPIYSFFADEDMQVAVGADQSIYVRERSNDFLLLPDVPAGHYTAAWAFSSADIWVGNSVGQVAHYDGAAWEVMETGSRDTTGAGILSMWGEAGRVYFITLSEFGWVDSKGVKMVVQRSPEAMASEPYLSPTSLWGRSKDEVFVGILDESFKGYRCGSAFMTWFDGSKFHQF